MDNDDAKRLDSIDIPVPCPMIWAELDGDERKKFCQKCDKHVHNLSDMSRSEAEELIKTNTGEICVSFLRNADGVVQTDECPGVLRPLRNIVFKAAGLVAGVLVAVSSFLPACAKDAPPTADGNKKSSNVWERITGGMLPPQQFSQSSQSNQATNRAWLNRLRNVRNAPAIQVAPPPVTENGVIHVAAFAETVQLKATVLTAATRFSHGGVEVKSTSQIDPVLTVKYAQKPSELPNRSQIWSDWAASLNTLLSNQGRPQANWKGYERETVAIVLRPGRQLSIAPDTRTYTRRQPSNPLFLASLRRGLLALQGNVALDFPQGVGAVQDVTLYVTFQQQDSGVPGNTAARKDK